MTQWTFEPVLSWPAILVVLGVLVALLAIRPTYRVLSRGQLRTLAVLRLVTIALLALGLARPGCVRMVERPQKVVLPVMIDVTRSMELPHEGSGTTRWQKLIDSLQAAQPQLRKLAERFEVQYFAFDGDLVAIESSEGWPSLPDGPSGAQSDYGAALAQVTERLRGERIAGSLILGDGVQNTDFPKVELPRAVREYSQLQSPLFAVPFGQAAEGDQIADIAVTNLPDQFAVFVKNEINIQGVVEVRGFANQEIPVQLLRVGQDGQEELLKSEVVVARQGDEKIPVNMRYTPTEPGEYRLVLRAEPQSREVVVRNNELPAFLTVYEGGLRVLYIEGELNYEQKYLRRSLAASQDLEVDFVWVDQRDRDRWPVNLVDQLSDSNYDVFILGDIDSRALHQPGGFEDNLKALALQVEKGKGLIMLGGEHSFGPGRYHSTPLNDLLPIQMQPYEAQDFGAPVNHSLHLERELVLRVASPHYLTRISGDDPNVWESLPPLLGANRFAGLKPRTQVLLETERGEPILVVGTVGGRVVAFAGDSTWRWWTLGDSQLHRRFWRQMVLWAAGLDGMNRQNVIIELPQRRFAQGSPLDFQVSAREPGGQALENASFSIEMTKPDGSQVPVVVSEQGEVRLANLPEGSLDLTGLYAIEASAVEGQKSIGSARIEFVVFDADREKSQPAASPDRLSRMVLPTAEFGGKLVDPDRLSSHIEDWLSQPAELSIEVPQRWLLGETFLDGLLFLACFVGVLGLEWYFRKKWGLV